MFSETDLTELVADQGDLRISVLMPTHVAGSETQQDPVRFNNLLGEARSQLTALGCSGADTERVLAPALSLVGRHEFWQHQERGLAVFVAGGQLRTYTLPVSVTEQVVVGERYHLTPLLPMVTEDGPFYVVTVTSREVEVFRATRFEMSRLDHQGPLAADDQGAGPDYQNPVQASPVARPHTGSVDISHAQVYGDSPEEWRKARLVDYARQVAAGIDQLVARDRAPVVLVAHPTLSGHVRRASTLTPARMWTVDADPASMDRAQQRDAAYAAWEPHRTAGRERASDRFRELRERHDERAETDTGRLAHLAQHGRIDTLLISETACRGRSREPGRAGDPSDGELDAVVEATLRRSGSVLVVPPALLADELAAALLRY